MSETPRIDLKVFACDDTGPFIYQGESMYPTFKPGQLIYVRPTIAALAAGDVIVFYDPVRQARVVHRVVMINGQQVFTRGDNNLENDFHPVQPENILGIVTSAEQNGVRNPVQGGNAGMRWMRRLIVQKTLIYKITRLLYPIFKCVKATKVVSKLWHPEIQKLHITTNDGALLKFIHRGKTVAIWDQSTDRFTCSFPYNLVLDDPQPNSL